MRPISILSGMMILTGMVSAGTASAQTINLNLNRPNTIQQLQIPNLQSQQRRENFQLQQQYYRDQDRANTATSPNSPNVPIVVPKCRSTIGGSLPSQSCR